MRATAAWVWVPRRCSLFTQYARLTYPAATSVMCLAAGRGPVAEGLLTKACYGRASSLRSEAGLFMFTLPSPLAKIVELHADADAIGKAIRPMQPVQPAQAPVASAEATSAV